MACAEALSRIGHSVCVIEKNEVGRAASWAGGGMLCPLPPDHVPEAIRDLLAESLALYPEWCARLHCESGVDPEYQECGADYFKSTGQHIEYPRMAQVRNPRLMKALAGTLRVRGVALFEHTEVQGWLEEQGRLKGVRTMRGDIACERAVLAAGAWSAALGAEGVRPAKGQMVLLRGAPGELPRMLIADDVYLIPRLDGHILVGSTIEDAGFDTTPTAEARDTLLARARRLWPRSSELPVVMHWAGLRPRPDGEAPTVGPHARIQGLWQATGHFRIGLTLAPATAARIVAQITSAA